MGEADSFEAHQEELRKAYKAGRKRALLQSIEMFILHRKPLSDWASTAFDEAYAPAMIRSNAEITSNKKSDFRLGNPSDRLTHALPPPTFSATLCKRLRHSEKRRQRDRSSKLMITAMPTAHCSIRYAASSRKTSASGALTVMAAGNGGWKKTSGASCIGYLNLQAIRRDSLRDGRRKRR
jgi:hypothetical protein